MASLADFLHGRPLLLLFGVAALGYFAGKLQVRGFSLGVAAVLFAGLLVGWLVPNVELPDFVAQLGLVLFVYTVGLASGPGFFSSLRRRGLRDNALVLFALCGSAALTLALGGALGIEGPSLAGLFAGSLTNTPALAAVVEALKEDGSREALGSAAVVAYSLCYPLGVLVPLAIVSLCDRWFRVTYATERISLAYRGQGEEPIVSATACVEERGAGRAETLRKGPRHSVNFGRFRRAGVTHVVHDETEFEPGDLVTVIGTRGDVETALGVLGQRSELQLELDRSEVDYRRMFVSNAEVTGRPLRDLHLSQRRDAVITRVRRGDVDLVPDSEFELLLGDRVRVVAPHARMPELAQLFGDSVRRVSEVDVITFGLGIALGLLLGAVPLPSPGGGSFSLGIAGGPLIAGLVLGRLGRTGPLVWSSPYSANLTLRQFGLVLFLAGVGLEAGGSLGSTLNDGKVLALVLCGLAVTTTSATLALLIGHRLFRIPLNVLVGTLAGLHTQPAVLALALEKTGRELPNVGYATVFPLAMIAKILLSQVLLRTGLSP